MVGTRHFNFIIFRDTEGNGLEFYVDNPIDEWSIENEKQF